MAIVLRVQSKSSSAASTIAGATFAVVSASLGTGVASVVVELAGFSIQRSELLGFGGVGLAMPWLAAAMLFPGVMRRRNIVGSRADLFLVLGTLVLATAMTMGEYRVERLSDGAWVIVRPWTSETGEALYLIHGVDHLRGMEFDTDGDGSFDCREEYLQTREGTSTVVMERRWGIWEPVKRASCNAYRELEVPPSVRRDSQG
jgi:hypothetical protein